MDKGMRKAKSVLKAKLQPPLQNHKQTKSDLNMSDPDLSPYAQRSSPTMATTQVNYLRFYTNPSETSYNPTPSPTRNPHVHTTATEKYYLQIISTMKKEMTSLLQIIKAKDKEIEQLMDAKMELKAVNSQLRSMLSEKVGAKAKKPNYLLSTSFDAVAEKQRGRRRNDVGRDV